MKERRKVELIDTCDYYFEEKRDNDREEGVGLVLDFCGFEHCLPRHSFGPYARSNYVIHVVLDGEGVLESRGKKRKIGRDHAFILYPGETTTYWADRSDPWFYCWIGFHGESADRVVESMGFTKDDPVVKVRESEEIGQLVRKMIGTKELDLDGQLRRYAYMMMFFSDLIADVAERIGISRSYLVKLMKQEMGMSPQEFLIATRMKRASEFLIRTDDSIRSVADECGYDDALAFSKVFKAKFGVNPSEYRLRYRERTAPSDEEDQ